MGDVSSGASVLLVLSVSRLRPSSWSFNRRFVTSVLSGARVSAHGCTRAAQLVWSVQFTDCGRHRSLGQQILTLSSNLAPCSGMLLASFSSLGQSVISVIQPGSTLHCAAAHPQQRWLYFVTMIALVTSTYPNCCTYCFHIYVMIGSQSTAACAQPYTFKVSHNNVQRY